MKKIIYLFVIASVIAIVVVSCNKQENKQKSIEYVAMWNVGEPEALFLQDMFDKFTEETGVEVKVSWVGRDNLNKLRTRFLSGDEPDLIDQGFSELGALFRGEVLLQDIDDLFVQKVHGEDNIVEDVLDKKISAMYRIDGKRYYFPLKLVTSGFFYDKKIFKKYGLTIPNTWSEFIENGIKMKNQNFPPLALDGTIAFYNAYYYYWAMQRIMGDGAFYAAAQDKTGNLWTTNKKYLEVAKLVSSLSKKESDFFQKGYAGSSWPAAQSDWAVNRSGSILVGSWIASETKSQQNAGFDIGYYPFPLVNGGVGRVQDMEILPFGFAIPKNAKNPDDAKNFLLYLMKEENQKKFVDMTDNFAPRIGIKYPDLLKDLEPYMKNANYHLVFDGVQQDFPEWVSIVFYPLDDKLIAGDISPEDFIQQLSENSKNYWDNKQ